ncbi:MAG TPA: AAA family ATPase [Gaiellaceae bacterium]|nr:AAA family ATPase [Gaiellaceae bacterium]
MSGAAPTGPLLERSGELARIESALAEARSGRGAFLVIEGPAGIGKTALVESARTAAADTGMRVLRSRGTELEREFAFGVVRQLFEPALAEASEPERANLLQAAAGVAAGLLGLPGAAPADAQRTSGVDPSFAILHGLYWLCANLAATAPLCVVVDDAHWADAPSLRYLTFLVTRLDELPLALVVAARPREPGAEAALLGTLTTAPAAQVLGLRPLTDAAVAQLVESRLAGDPDAAFVEACVRATRGTPFLVHELLGALAAERVAPTAAAARRVDRIGARTVGRSIVLRLGRLPEPARRLARALAILDESDLLQASRLAGLEEAEAAEAAELLADAGLVEPGRPLRFVHPIVRRGLYEELSSAERGRGHRRAAELLAGQPGAQERVAEHLLGGEPAGDVWVVRQLVDAACAAGRNGAAESEAVFLRRALAEPPPPGERSGLLLDLGMAEASAGLDDWSEHMQESVDTAPDAEAAGAAALVLGLALSRAQRFAEAVAVLDRAATSVADPDSDLALALEAAAVVAALNDPETAPSVALRRETVLARAASDQAAPPELLAAAAFICVLTKEPAELGADLAARALLAGGTAPPASGVPPWFAFATWFSQTTLSLLWAERYAEVRPLLDESIAQARATGDGGRLAVGLAHRGLLALRCGDLCAAEADTRTALAAAELPAPILYRLLNAGVLVETLVEQGELETAEQVLGPNNPEIESGSITASVLRLARGRLRVAQGRAREGLDDFLAVGTRLTRVSITCPSYLPWRSEAALAQRALGEPDAARRLAEEELALARAFGTSRALGVAQRALGVVIGGDRGELLLRDAVESFERAGAGLERARALADLGALLRRRNRRTEARALLREALDAAHRAGAGPLAARAETELRATGARPRRILLTGVESLTASERRVAELASQDLTNREIAQTLFITTRTVEGHLTSVFRKLQLESRDELPAALAGARVPA